ncbi:MAG: DPP IV N-terminal domain-containing protein, partial [Planctomycetota bacterium]
MTLSHRLILLVLMPLCGSMAVSAQQAEPLSLRSIYHPEDRFNYDGTIPPTHWLDDSPSKLLVRRDSQWHRVDLRTMDETPWSEQDSIQSRIEALDGLDDKKIMAATHRVIASLPRTGATVLSRIDGGLALISPDQPARWLTREAKSWGNATLDPTDRRVGYTCDGDFFVVDVASGLTVRITDDATDTMLDGVLDWTYQEEIFGRGNYKGFWFSPDGNFVAVLQVDISAIPPYVLTAASTDRGESVTRRYSKAGDPIPHAALLLVDLRPIDSGEPPSIRGVIKSTRQEPLIVTGVWWHPHSGCLHYTISDRLQTWRELFSLSPNENPISLICEESPAWVEPPSAPAMLTDGSLVWRSAIPTGFHRLLRISADGSENRPITPGEFDVRSFFVGPNEDFAIVTGHVNQGIVGQQAYRIPIAPGSSRPVAPTELVPITHRPGWHSIDISPDAKTLLSRHSRILDPPDLLVRSTLGGPTHVMTTNKLALTKKIHEPELLSIDTPDGHSLPAILVRPREVSHPIPVVVSTYGGPSAPSARDRWSGRRAMYRQLLAREGIASLVVDTRSSGASHPAEVWPIKGRVGESESKDMDHVAKWLRQQPWVAADRIGLRGWSFGGYLTLLTMTKSTGYAAGVAGGSVTDWQEYDSFYTERYMGLPDDNAENYRANSPLYHAKSLSGRVLMIHGEVDDNVHPSNTLRMA